MNNDLAILSNDEDSFEFPPIEKALKYPNGLLAIGGQLSTKRLLAAYRNGIFPWFDESQPLLWWSPDPRMVLFPHKLKISRSFRKTLRRKPFYITRNHAFHEVISACAAPRRNCDETWIGNAMIYAYVQLHELNWAHSIECWQHGKLVGGLYGIAMGNVFFGESMFSLANDASKIALHYLCQQNYELIDCQVSSPHLKSLGSEEIPRDEFMQLLNKLCDKRR